MMQCQVTVMDISKYKYNISINKTNEIKLNFHFIIWITI